MSMHRCFVLSIFVSFVLFVGCKDKRGTEPVTESSAGQAVTAIPYPTPEMLEKLGSENKLETRWLLPEPIFLIAGQPKRFLKSPIGIGNEALLAGTIEQILQVPFAPIKIERFVQSSSFPGQVQIEVDQNGVKVPQPRLISRRSTLLVFDEPIEKDKLFASIFGNSKEDAESKKRKPGEIEYYDLTPTEIAVPQRLAISFVDDKTLAIVEGLETDVKTVFEPKGESAKSAAIDRLKRLDLDSNDLVLVTSLEGIDLNPQSLSAVLLQAGVPQNFVDSLVKHLRAATLSVNLTVPVGSPMVTVRFDARDAQGATEIGETVQGLILVGQTTLAAMDEETKKTLPVPAEFAKSVLNAIAVKTEEAKVEIVLRKFDGFEETAAGGIRNQQTAMQQMQLQQQRMDQMMMLGQVFMTYFQKNNKFPSDVRAADGKPLLSWRVSLLPMLGLDELYGKFKQDEPWDSETNKPLMETMPRIFQSLTPGVEPFKAVIRFFDSEGTPLSNPNLKPEELKNPQSTLLFVAVKPEKAVEWTKPETLPFELDKIEETVGAKLFGLTFSGQFVPDMPIIPLSDPRSEQQRKYLEAMVKGLPLPTPPTTEPAMPEPEKEESKTEEPKTKT